MNGSARERADQIVENLVGTNWSGHEFATLQVGVLNALATLALADAVEAAAASITDTLNHTEFHS